MIALYEKYARGGWLLDESGSVYTCGESPFYGSFKNGLIVGENVIASAMKGKNSYIVLTNFGNLHSVGEDRESMNVNSEELSRSEQFLVGAIFGDNVAMLDSNGIIHLKKISKLKKNNFNGDSYKIKNVSIFEIKELVFTNSGCGLYLLTEKGEVQSFGDAIHYGDLITENVTAIVVSIAARPWGNGYWILDSIGGVFCYGDCDYFGSIPGDEKIVEAVKIKPHSSGRGYWVIDQIGNIFPFGYSNIIQVDPKMMTNEISDFIPEEVLNNGESLQGSKSITSYLFEYIKSKNESEEKYEIL